MKIVIDVTFDEQGAALVLVSHQDDPDQPAMLFMAPNPDAAMRQVVRTLREIGVPFPPPRPEHTQKAGATVHRIPARND